VSEARQQALEAWLTAGAGIGAPAERRIDTPISAVFLFRDKVLKLKKAVDFGFLDFTTLDQRRWAVGRELDMNRETAPDVYRAAYAIVARDDGFALAPFETEGAIDYVLEMRRFDETAVLSECPERVDGALAEQLGRTISRFHIKARLGAAGGGAAGSRYVMDSNAGLMRGLADEVSGVLDPAAVERALAATEAAFASVETLLDQRLAGGFVRACHGDLHLGNIVLEGERPILFDRIEFNDKLIEIDVLYDLAFLLMDLDFRGRRGEANRAFNAWLDEAARGFGDALFTGLAALPLFLAIRAAVRCHVAGHNNAPDAARAYLAAAEAHLQPCAPQLIAVGGLSGSGKSTVSRALAPSLGGAPGAVVLRSDELRKRLWGCDPLTPLPPEAYGPGESERVYAEMRRLAGLCLAAGRSVILDAVHLKAEEQTAAEALARAHGVPFQGLWLEAPAEVLRERVGARTGDASDADISVLEGQLRLTAPETTWRRVQATTASDSLLRLITPEGGT
jgi:aminoglycoside phosphotransferase family enzyme/predicted kinase